MRIYNCPKCKKELSEEMQFCPFCGNKNFEFVTTKKFNYANLTSEKKKFTHTKTIIIAVLIFIVISLSVSLGVIVTNSYLYTEDYNSGDLYFTVRYNQESVSVDIYTATDVKNLGLVINFHGENGSVSTIREEVKGITRESDKLTFTYQMSDIKFRITTSDISYIKISSSAGKIRQIDV